MQTRKKRLVIERMRFKKWTLFLLSGLLIASLSAEVTQINDNYVIMTTENLRVFVQDSEELRILKEGKETSARNNKFYLGGNMGTYGIGISAGVIF